MMSQYPSRVFPFLVAVYIAIGLIFSVFEPVGAVDISKQVNSSGAVRCNLAGLYLKGAVGQAVVPVCSSGLFYLKSGFFQTYMTIDAGQCHPGDANNDDNFNILDVVYLINYKYKGGPSPTPDEICSGDADCDCEVNILDAVLLINYIYKSGSPPCDYADWRSACAP
ncbi:MAG TPA: hypothetical protein ENL22_08225 [candidate division Zixibacteria bacterium]|nr:hypothetical protein [candidate division Zixibacteria bacterium]